MEPAGGNGASLSPRSREEVGRYRLGVSLFLAFIETFNVAITVFLLGKVEGSVCFWVSIYMLATGCITGGILIWRFNVIEEPLFQRRGTRFLGASCLLTNLYAFGTALLPRLLQSSSSSPIFIGCSSLAVAVGFATAWCFIFHDCTPPAPAPAPTTGGEAVELEMDQAVLPVQAVVEVVEEDQVEQVVDVDVEEGVEQVAVVEVVEEDQADVEGVEQVVDVDVEEGVEQMVDVEEGVDVDVEEGVEQVLDVEEGVEQVVDVELESGGFGAGGIDGC